MAKVLDIEVTTPAISFETLTIAGSSTGLTRAKYRFPDNKYKEARIAFITLDGTAGTNDVRFTIDGTTPVATTTGHLAVAGDTIVVKGCGNIEKFRAIREGSTSGTLQVTYFI